jgi:hypothetical protein
MVQLKVLAALDVRLILVEVPLHMDFVAALVTAGRGFTVTVIVKGLPAQEPVVEVGGNDILYCTRCCITGLVSV